MLRFLYKIFFVLIVISFVGCGGDSSHNKKVSLLGYKNDITKVNPNSLAVVSADKALDRKNKVELSKIEANAKIEIAKIKSENQLNIAKVNAQTQQELAKSEATTKISTSKLDASTKKETMQYTVYIVIAVIVFLTIALILLYLNGKRNRELKRRLQEERFHHEQMLKAKELEEKRFHKILELAAAGKLPESIEEEIILSISSPKAKVIDSK